MEEARARFVLETVAILSRIEQTSQEMRRCISWFLLWIIAVVVLFHLLRLPMLLPLILASLLLLVLKAVSSYLRGSIGIGIRMANLRLRRVTLGIRKEKSAARFEFEDGSRTYLMDLDAYEVRAVEAFTRLNGTSLYHLRLGTSIVQFRASVNRGRHFIWGLALCTTRSLADIRDLLDRCPSGGAQLGRLIAEETRRTLQWDLRGIEMKDLGVMFRRCFLLTGIPYGIDIILAIPFPSHNGR